MANLYFLNDIFHNLNSLNLDLQGRNKTVSDIVEKLDAFQRKMDLFVTDLNSLKCCISQHSGHHQKLLGTNYRSYDGFLRQTALKMYTRFDNFNISPEVMQCIKDPFSVDARGAFGSKPKEVLT